ncbi:DUF5805 domain-containing protein [Natronosalvus vescus]|uniref:DUF5805 domain-containing protein n=1 Tax=Natronosalvus vescus TaxID=2953881 RepID=UPI0020901CB0|nr:DUF5805 domain-containing protein [Natronosalvus vescus]
MPEPKLNVGVPEHQLAIYDDEAEEMGFSSRAEYIRSMINAGRREFGLNPQGETPEDASLRGSLDERILAILEEAEGLAQDEVVDAVTADVEDQVTEVLNDLNDEGRIDYDVRRSGFVVAEGQ